MAGESGPISVPLPRAMINRWFLRNRMWLRWEFQYTPHPSSYATSGWCRIFQWPFVKPFIIYEKVQLTGFCIQESIISGLYILEAFRALRPILAIRGPTERKVVRRLILVNIFVVAMDITLLVTEYTNNFDIQTTYKPVVYSVKLKMEFIILNHLLKVMEEGNRSWPFSRSLARGDIQLTGTNSMESNCATNGSDSTGAGTSGYYPNQLGTTTKGTIRTSRDSGMISLVCSCFYYIPDLRAWKGVLGGLTVPETTGGDTRDAGERGVGKWSPDGRIVRASRASLGAATSQPSPLTFKGEVGGKAAAVKGGHFETRDDYISLKVLAEWTLIGRHVYCRLDVGHVDIVGFWLESFVSCDEDIRVLRLLNARESIAGPRRFSGSSEAESENGGGGGCCWE
ncbi:hypothetical protein K469DRAFT_692431 [Zopfia rhizophila CBS 207.26]|uniref:DUF7703 domain-containing protein n=1 Tax=Zopfia rhizophila CBS 207.26 TaxID=1314779 RepID=A0A6A6DMW1_9PEZI|nr:hypothetical protein K469DRAFT_692431 [Zopfia rhizophila CBS 207.26]